MSSPFAAMLEKLVAHPRLRGALVAGRDDGIIIDSSLEHGVDGPALAALGTALFRKAHASTEASGLGSVRFLRLEAEGGHVCVVGNGEVVIVAVAAAEQRSKLNVGHFVPMLAPGQTSMKTPVRALAGGAAAQFVHVARAFRTVLILAARSGQHGLRAPWMSCRCALAPRYVRLGATRLDLNVCHSRSYHAGRQKQIFSLKRLRRGAVHPLTAFDGESSLGSSISTSAILSLAATHSSSVSDQTSADLKPSSTATRGSFGPRSPVRIAPFFPHR